jgi:hypothetical protein
MSVEKKDGLREKERLSKKAKCCIETQEECAKCKNTICECIMRKQQTETEGQAAKHKITNCDQNKRKQQTETEEQAAKRKNNNRDCIMRSRILCKKIFT